MAARVLSLIVVKQGTPGVLNRAEVLHDLDGVEQLQHGLHAGCRERDPLTWRCWAAARF